MSTEDDREFRRGTLRSYGIFFFVGFVLGVVIALTSKPQGEVFLTNSLSYVPADQWLVHGVVIGLSLAAVRFALWLSMKTVGYLFSKGLFFLVVGLGLVTAGVGVLVLALTEDSLDSGQVSLFLVMGLIFLVMGGYPVYLDLRRRSDERSQK